MHTSKVSATFVFFVLALTGVLPAHAGDSAYGKVTEVKRADLVVMEFSGAQHELHLVGVEVPTDARMAAQATDFVSELILGKNARMRLAGRTQDGKLVVRLFTDDPEIGIKEVSVELVRFGLARRQKDVDFKYGELSSAEEEAQAANRGLWATAAQ